MPTFRTACELAVGGRVYSGDFYFEEYGAHYVEILFEARTLFPELQQLTLATANNSWERNHAMLSAGNRSVGRIWSCHILCQV